MRVAVAQVQAEALDVAGNTQKTLAAIVEAAGSGADLAVLPEAVSVGWIMDRTGIEPLAESGDGGGPVLSAWRAAAIEHDIAVIGGYAERAGDELFNSVAVIDRCGVLIGGYRKLHLFGADEATTYAPGDLGLPVFELDGVRVGVLVCYDLRFPEAMRLLAIQGADLIAVPTAWVVAYDPKVTVDSERIGQVDGALVQANLNQVYVACADLTGVTGTVEFLGRSLIADPYGEALAGPLPAAGEQLAIADIDPKVARAARDRGNGVSPRDDRRTDVYSLHLAQAPVAGDAMLAEIARKRGYVLDLHRTLAARDPQFLAGYENFVHAGFLRERSLDRRVKELVYIGVLMALGAPEEHQGAHMRAAVDHGATEREVLEVLEQTLVPAGVPRFIAALRVFVEAFPDRDPGT